MFFAIISNAELHLLQKVWVANSDILTVIKQEVGPKASKLILAKYFVLL